MKRVPLVKPITPDLKAKCERFLELDDAHREAIQGGDQSFYDDGRHEELLALGVELRAALNAKPWHDWRGMIEEALNAAE